MTNSLKEPRTARLQDPQVAACADKVHFLKDGVIAASAETQGDPARISQLYLETYK